MTATATATATALGPPRTLSRRAEEALERLGDLRSPWFEGARSDASTGDPVRLGVQPWA